MNHPVCCIRPQCDVCLDPSRSFNMVSVSMIKLYCITAVIAAAVGLYFVAAQIDELARDKYMTMKPTNGQSSCKPSSVKTKKRIMSLFRSTP